MVTATPNRVHAPHTDEVLGFTLSQISRAVGAHTETLRLKVVNGLIRGQKLGNTYVVSPAEVERVFPGLKIG